MKSNTKDKGKSGIYLIRNLINGKIYIGKAKCINKRIKQHITNLNKKVRSHENDHFINAWHKYGRDNFSYCVLEYLPLNEKLLSEKEIYFILKYNSNNNKKGYNKRLDSSTGLIVSEETRLKLSNAQRKRFESKTERDIIGNKSKEFWKNNPEIKKQMSEKVSDKIRKYKIGKFEYNTNNLLEIFDKRADIKLKYPDYYTQAILGCCQGTKKSYKGFYWKYIDIKTNNIINK